jgi:hypothetical protein
MPFTHGAGHGIAKKLICFGISADEIECCTDHVSPGGGNDGVCLCVYASAEFITLTGRNFKCFPGAYAEIGAVFSAARGSVISCGDDFIIANNDCTVFPPQACGTNKYGICDVEIIVLLAGSAVHNAVSLFRDKKIIVSDGIDVNMIPK